MRALVLVALLATSALGDVRLSRRHRDDPAKPAVAAPVKKVEAKPAEKAPVVAEKKPEAAKPVATPVKKVETKPAEKAPVKKVEAAKPVEQAPVAETKPVAAPVKKVEAKVVEKAPVRKVEAAKPVEKAPAAVVAPPKVEAEKKPAEVVPPKVEAPLVNAAANKNSLRAQKAPAPAAAAPAPAPLTQEDQIKAMKEKMAEKVGHYDADYVLDRPTTVPPGHDGQLAPGPKTNLVPNQKPAVAGAPGAAPAPAAAPAGVPDTGMTEAALNSLVKHNDNETFTDDWGKEYGPHGPQGVHGPYQPMGSSSAGRDGLGAFVAVGLAAALLSCRA